jgi:hypothetical protein
MVLTEQPEDRPPTEGTILVIEIVPDPNARPGGGVAISIHV